MRCIDIESRPLKNLFAVNTLTQGLALGCRALVHPDYGRMQCLPICADRYHAIHLCGKAYRANIPGGDTAFRKQFADDYDERLDPALDRLFCPEWTRVIDRISLIRLTEHLTLQREQYRLRSLRAHVTAYHVIHR